MYFTLSSKETTIPHKTCRTMSEEMPSYLISGQVRLGQVRLSYVKLVYVRLFASRCLYVFLCLATYTGSVIFAEMYSTSNVVSIEFIVMVKLSNKLL